MSPSRLLSYHNIVDSRVGSRRKQTEKLFKEKQETWTCDNCGCQMLDTYSTCIVCEDEEEEL